MAADDDGPFLRTGDLGFLWDEQLYVTGRLKEVLIIRGRNHYPHDLELTMQRAHPCLLPGAGAAFAIEAVPGEQVVLVQEVDRAYRSADLEEVIRAVRRNIVDEHEVEAHAVVLIRQASLPRTTSGKVQRRRCRDHYLAGELKVLAEWTRPHARLSHASRQAGPDGEPHSDLAPPPLQRLSAEGDLELLAEQVEAQLLRWLHQRAGVAKDQIDRDRPFAEMGIDSLAGVELIAELESWSGVNLSAVAAWEYPTAAALSRHLAVQLAQRDQGCSKRAPDTHPSESNDEFERLLAEVEGMSDEEASRDEIAEDPPERRVSH